MFIYCRVHDFTGWNCGERSTMAYHGYWPGRRKEFLGEVYQKYFGCIPFFSLIKIHEMMICHKKSHQTPQTLMVKNLHVPSNIRWKLFALNHHDIPEIKSGPHHFPIFSHQPAVNELGSKGFLLGLRGGTGLWQKSLCSSTFSLSNGTVCFFFSGEETCHWHGWEHDGFLEREHLNRFLFMLISEDMMGTRW